MNIARPTKEDLEQAKDLSSLLQCLLVYGSFPDEQAPTPDGTEFDIEDAQSCQAAMRLIVKAFDHGTGLGRVIWGMDAVCDPRNGVLDFSTTTLRLAEHLLRAAKASADV